MNQQFNYRPIRPVARRLGQDGHTGGAGGKESCVQPKDDQSPVRLRQSNDDRSYDSVSFVFGLNKWLFFTNSFSISLPHLMKVIHPRQHHRHALR